MKSLISLLVFLSFMIVSSCGSKSSNTERSAIMMEKSFTNTNQQPTDKVSAPDDRKIIKDGDITFETSNIDETRSLITKTTEELKGYITKESAGKTCFGFSSAF